MEDVKNNTKLVEFKHLSVGDYFTVPRFDLDGVYVKMCGVSSKDFVYKGSTMNCLRLLGPGVGSAYSPTLPEAKHLMSNEKCIQISLQGKDFCV